MPLNNYKQLASKNIFYPPMLLFSCIDVDAKVNTRAQWNK